MSTRSARRMKVVLPVTVIRNDRPEKQLAHTLDITSDSARLGGLYIPVEPGELIDIQRGVLRAKFYVFWVGAPNTMLAGQAGIRGLIPKSIWGVELPPDSPDQTVNTQDVRTGLPLVRAAHANTDRRWQTRHACQGRRGDSGRRSSPPALRPGLRHFSRRRLSGNSINPAAQHIAPRENEY